MLEPDTVAASAKRAEAPQPCPCCPVCNPKGIAHRTTKLGEAPKRKFFRVED